MAGGAAWLGRIHGPAENPQNDNDERRCDARKHGKRMSSIVHHINGPGDENINEETRSTQLGCDGGETSCAIPIEHHGAEDKGREAEKAQRPEGEEKISSPQSQ